MDGLWRGELSLRKLSIYVARLPAGSAVWAAELRIPYGTTPETVLLADVYHALTGEPHPLRPKVTSGDDRAAGDMVRALRAQRERLQGRRPDNE